MKMEELSQVRDQIDYQKTKLDERKNIVNSILEDKGEQITDYFDGTFKSNLNNKDKLSHEDNVSRTLESLANYLLNSDEVKEQKKDEDFKYVFHTDEKYFQKKIKRENSIEGMSTNANEDTVIHFLVRSKRNSKNEKIQQVKKSDLKRDGFIGQVLRDYNDELERISEMLKKKNYNSSGQRYLLTRASGQIKSDMVIAKDSLLGVFGYNSNPSESTDYNLENIIDFRNALHIEALMRTRADFEPDNELAYIVDAFEYLANNTLLKPIEREILSMLRERLKNNEIAENVFLTPQRIGQIVRVIANKIAKKACEYDEY